MHLHPRAVFFVSRLALQACAFGLLLNAAALSPAAQSDQSQTVTFQVNGVLSIDADTQNFTLTFGRFEKGTDSNTQTVLYQIKCNTMTPAQLKGAVAARIGSAIDGIDLKADVGEYQNSGSPGNGILTESFAGFGVVAESLQGLADKPATSGSQAKILHGQLPVTWKASAKEDLSSGTYQTQITVTLKDS